MSDTPLLFPLILSAQWMEPRIHKPARSVTQCLNSWETEGQGQQMRSRLGIKYMGELIFQTVYIPRASMLGCSKMCFSYCLRIL